MWMSGIEKLIVRILSLPKDFSWEELVKLLSHFGYSEIDSGKTSGSRRKFADSENRIISLHKPHPGNILKYYQVKQILEHLIEADKLHE